MKDSHENQHFKHLEEKKKPKKWTRHLFRASKQISALCSLISSSFLTNFKPSRCLPYISFRNLNVVISGWPSWALTAWCPEDAEFGRH